MKAFRALLGVSFKSLLITTTSLGRNKKKSRAVSSIGALLLLCFLMLFISASYSFSMAMSFSMLGAMDVMLMLMVLFAILFPFMMVVYAAQAMVFSTKDIDLVLSLPVSAFGVMLSRVMALYLEALLMVELLLLPAGIFYLAFGGAGGILLLPLLVVLGAFLALIPTALALVFGALVSIVVSRLKHKNLFNVIFSLLFFIVIMVGSFSLSFTGSMAHDAGFDMTGLRDGLSAGFPPLAWSVRAVTGSPLHFLLIIAISVAPFLLITWAFSRSYKNILTRLSSTQMRNDYKLKRVAATGSFRALLGKEFRKFFGTPAYVLNSAVGVLLTFIGSVVVLFKRADILGFIEMLASEGLDVSGWISPMLLGAVLFVGSFMYISCVSISLEGKTLWILKEAPLSVGKIFAAKAGVNFIMGAATSLLCVPVLGIAFAVPVVDILCILVVALLFPLFISVMGLQANLWLPRMDAESEAAVIKQSGSVIVTMLLSWLVFGLLIGLYFVLSALGLPFVAYCGIASVLLVGLNALFIAMLNTQGRRQFAAL